MNSDLKKLLLYHLFNGIAISVVGNYLFLDAIFLRYDLDLKQFGFIKGVATWLPLAVGLMLSPALNRLQADKQIIGIVYLIRVALPFLLFLATAVTHDAHALAMAFAAILTLTFIFPVIGNNAMQVVFRTYIPADQLGKQLGVITTFWSLSSYLAVIPCSLYLDRHSQGTDEEFLRSLMIIFLLTTVMQLPASWLIWRLSPQKKSTAVLPLQWMQIFEPFRHQAFRPLLVLLTALSALGAMVEAFINPYLFNSYKLTIFHISLIDAGVMLGGVALLPGWGSLIDRFGSKNVLRISVLGLGLGVLCLGAQGPFFLAGFILLAWRGANGIFGFAAGMSRQILAIALSEPGKTNVFVAAAGFVTGAGYFVGALVGGNLLDWLAVRMRPEFPFDHYHVYYVFCGLALLLVGGLVPALPDSRPQMSPVELAVAAWRSLRGKAGRS